MKTFPTRLVFLLIFLFVFAANGQEDEVGLLVDDLLKVAEVFTSPAAEGITYQSGVAGSPLQEPLVYGK